MRKTRDGHKRQNQYDLEKLKVGKLTVLTFFPSEIFVWNPHPLKEGHKLGKCGIDSFSREKVADLRFCSWLWVIVISCLGTSKLLNFRDIRKSSKPFLCPNLSSQPKSETWVNYNYEMLRAFVQYTLNVDLNAPVIKDLVEKYKDIEQFNRSITDKYVAICKRF